MLIALLLQFADDSATHAGKTGMAQHVARRVLFVRPATSIRLYELSHAGHANGITAAVMPGPADLRYAKRNEPCKLRPACAQPDPGSRNEVKEKLLTQS
jgi:hypothetical protein